MGSSAAAFFSSVSVLTSSKCLEIVVVVGFSWKKVNSTSLGSTMPEDASCDTFPFCTASLRARSVSVRHLTTENG